MNAKKLKQLRFEVKMLVVFDLSRDLSCNHFDDRDLTVRIRSDTHGSPHPFRPGGATEVRPSRRAGRASRHKRFDPSAILRMIAGNPADGAVQSCPSRLPPNPRSNLMPVKFQPDGFHTLTPYLTIRNAAAALDFYKKAFHAVELMRMAGPDGKVMHAEMRIGDSIVMMSDEFPEMGCTSPQKLGGSPCTLMLYVDDVDVWFPRAIAAGGKVRFPVKDQFYGDRSGTFEDPFGHMWVLSTHKEDLTPDEISKRAQACGH